LRFIISRCGVQGVRLTSAALRALPSEPFAALLDLRDIGKKTLVALQLERKN